MTVLDSHRFEQGARVPVSAISQSARFLGMLPAMQPRGKAARSSQENDAERKPATTAPTSNPIDDTLPPTSAADVESAIRKHHARGDLRTAATIALKCYGQELFRFVRMTVGSDQDAADIHAEIWEDIWSGLSQFEWRSSFRTWAYALAKHACSRYLRHPNRRKLRPLSEAGLSRLEHHLRTTTWYLKDEVRDKVAALRDRLDPDERALLYLRVDRNMPWRDIAQVLRTNEDDSPTEAALRQQFTRLKKRLREMAQQERLLPDNS